MSKREELEQRLKQLYKEEKLVYRELYDLDCAENPVRKLLAEGHVIKCHWWYDSDYTITIWFIDEQEIEIDDPLLPYLESLWKCQDVKKIRNGQDSRGLNIFLWKFRDE